jgi:hypothetical protein
MKNFAQRAKRKKEAAEEAALSAAFLLLCVLCANHLSRGLRPICP